MQSDGSPSASPIPPGYLRPGENVILQCKPDRRAFVTMGLLILGGVLGLVWLLAIVGAGLAYGAVGAVVVAVVLFLILLLPVGLLMLGALRRWRASWYALTDQRVIVAGTGLSSMSTVATDFPLVLPPGQQQVGVTIYRVSQVSVQQGYFARKGGFGNVVFLAQPSSFVWTGVINPEPVKSQLWESFVAIQEMQAGNRAAWDKLTARASEHYVVGHEDDARRMAASTPAPPGRTTSGMSTDRDLRGNQVLVRCPFCGNMNPENVLKCPSCGATVRGPPPPAPPS